MICYMNGDVETNGVPRIRCGNEGMKILRADSAGYAAVVKFVSLGMTFYACVMKDTGVYIRRSLLSVSRLTGLDAGRLIKEFKA